MAKSRRFHDFDKQFAEMKRETMAIKLFGREYSFTARIPAWLPLELSRQEEGEEVSNFIMFKAAREIFGDATVKEWRKLPEFDTNMLTMVIQTVFQMINGTFEGEDEPAEISEDDMGAPAKK